MANDFDGTLCLKGDISVENLVAIRKWQAAEHKFGLVTGRNLHLVEVGLKGYDIRLDLCVGLKGAVIFDSKGTEAFSSEMPKKPLRVSGSMRLPRKAPTS